MPFSLLLSKAHRHLRNTPVANIPGAWPIYERLVKASGKTKIHGGMELEILQDTNTHYASGFEQHVVNVFKTEISHGDTVLELGCSIGYFTMLFSKLVGSEGSVIGYEVDPKRYEVLKRNVQRNNCNNIQIYNLAASDKSTNFTISSGDKQFEAESVKLDNHLNESIDVVKIDIEGAELNALDGMSKTITKNRPTIICEVHPNHLKNYGQSVTSLQEFINTHNYSIFHITHENGPTEFNGKVIKVNKFAEGREHYLFKPNEIDDTV